MTLSVNFSVFHLPGQHLSGSSTTEGSRI